MDLQFRHSNTIDVSTTTTKIVHTDLHPQGRPLSHDAALAAADWEGFACASESQLQCALRLPALALRVCTDHAALLASASNTGNSTGGTKTSGSGKNVSSARNIASGAVVDAAARLTDVERAACAAHVQRVAAAASPTVASLLASFAYPALSQSPSDQGSSVSSSIASLLASAAPLPPFDWSAARMHTPAPAQVPHS